MVWISSASCAREWFLSGWWKFTTWLADLVGFYRCSKPQEIWQITREERQTYSYETAGVIQKSWPAAHSSVTVTNPTTEFHQYKICYSQSSAIRSRPRNGSIGGRTGRVSAERIWWRWRAKSLTSRRTIGRPTISNTDFPCGKSRYQKVYAGHRVCTSSRISGFLYAIQ